MHPFTPICLMAMFAVGASAANGSPAPLTVTLGGAAAGAVMPDRQAFCAAAGQREANVSPAVSWSPGPKGVRSYALRLQDLDVPAAFDQIEKPGVVIAKDAPRVRVDHWVLADIPAHILALPEGADSTEFVKGGKQAGPTDHGVRGVNIYARFFAAKPDMAGPYAGYDGPCPPRNDEKPHRYVLHVYALDVASLKLDGAFTGEAMARAMTGHVLAEGETFATYSRWEAGK
jgi:Raf kinase inhibitor-like YbhB/YbcL family protein